MRFYYIPILLVLACDSPTVPEPFVPGPAATFNVREGLVRLLTQDSAQLEVEVRDAAGYLLADSAVTWVVRDPQIASVSNEGRVRAVAPGWTVIHASRPGFTDSTWIAVSPAYKSVSAGLSFGCGITITDELHCWGQGSPFNYKGTGRAATPLHFESDTRQVVAGWDHACRLTIDQQAWCFGRDQHGQLGDGERRWDGTASEVLLPEPLMSISSSQYHTCGVTSNDASRPR